MKPIAIVFSDLHINLWSKFNEDNKRTLNSFKVLIDLSEKAHKLKIPLLSCGDLFNNPERIDQELAVLVKDNFSNLPNNLYSISGNHDIKFRSVISEKLDSWVSVLSGFNINNLDYSSLKLNKDTTVYGIPYIDKNVGISEYIKSIKLKTKHNILLLHTDFPGARDSDGRRIDSVQNLNLNTLKKFDLVLCGHIHKPQRLSKKVYMIGSPNQLRRTDKDGNFGYWVIYKDLSIKFKELKGYPKFIDVESPDAILDDGNYYTVIPKINIDLKNTESDNNINISLSKRSIAKEYLKKNGITDKSKISLLKSILKESEQ